MSQSVDDDVPSDDSFWGQLDDASHEVADWSGDELEAAYLKAMEALEASEAQFPELPDAISMGADDAGCSDGDDPDGHSQSAPEHSVEPTAPALQIADAGCIEKGDRLSRQELAAELEELSEQARGQQAAAPPASTAIAPRQILEALLFVGGEPLTTRKLGHVLRGEFSTEFIESQLDELNSQYTRQGRPYEIRLGEGGYRMVLRAEFERIRRKAYGLGPKDVKLSQEAIEVLALIAYHQPLTAARIEELGKPGCAAVLRQLLRRELISVVRSPEVPREVTYRTTPRFLSLFGIRSLNELPRLEQVAYK